MAKYTMELKLEIVKHVLNGMTQNEAVKRYGVVKGDVQKWVATYQAHGEANVAAIPASLSKLLWRIHYEHIIKEIRDNMPILGINLHIAPEWGVICGYKNNDADILCRTKYDANVLGKPDYKKGKDNPYDYLYMENWPFLISYFTGHTHLSPSETDNLINFESFY